MRNEIAIATDLISNKHVGSNCFMKNTQQNISKSDNNIVWFQKISIPTPRMVTGSSKGKGMSIAKFLR